MKKKTSHGSKVIEIKHHLYFKDVNLYINLKTDATNDFTVKNVILKKGCQHIYILLVRYN